MAFISLSSSPSPPAPNDSCSSKNPFEDALRSLAFVVALAISALPEYPPNPNVVVVVVVVVAPVRRLELLDAAARWVWGRLPPMLSTTTTRRKRVSGDGEVICVPLKM
jgi:hypothetical protein